MPRKVIERSASVASAGFSLMIARRSPAAKVSAPPPAVAKVPADAPIPKVIVPIEAPFLQDVQIGLSGWRSPGVTLAAGQIGGQREGA